jgi:membrane protein
MLPLFIRKTWVFLTRDLWRIRARRLSRGRGFLVRLLRVVVIAGRGFKDDKCQLRASALTFYSLLSVVPVVAMAFGIATGFGLDKNLETELGSVPASYQPVIEKVVEFSKQLLQQTQSGLVAGIGVLILFYTVIKVLGQIENSFNDIWGIKRSRSFGRKLADYLMAMLVGPLLFMVSSGATVFISTQVKGMLGDVALVGPAVGLLLRALPWAVTWVLFTFVYIFMPNTKVKLSSALIAGIVAGSTYQVLQWGLIAFGVSVSKYNAIYGAFAALPLFLFWLQLSWLVVLFGAEISFAWQNVETYEFEPDCLLVSRKFKRTLTVWIAQLLVKSFDQEEQPLTAANIHDKLEIPVRLVNEILFDLVAVGVARETREDESQDVAYLVARPLERFTIKYVLDALDERGTHDIPVRGGPDIEKIRESLAQMAESVEQSDGNVALKDI